MFTGANTGEASPSTPPAVVAAKIPEDQMAGDQAVDVGAWFDAHAAFLARCIQRLAGLHSPVDDLVQEVFVVALRKQTRIDPAVSPRGWLYRTAANLVWHHRRSLARRLAAERRLAQQPTTEQPTSEEPLLRAEQARLVRDCVARLPFSQREAFVLFELEGVSGAEISSLLEIPLNTVWSRLHHARKSFRELWNLSERERRLS